jgi:hypothetical protein
VRGSVSRQSGGGVRIQNTVGHGTTVTLLLSKSTAAGAQENLAGNIGSAA